MDISTVILSFNSERTLGKCLDDLLAALEDIEGEHEVFVVDNGSNESCVQLIEDYQR